MPRDVVELTKQIKAANDILDVIGGYVPVTQSGNIYKAICPFHNDTRPSLQIDRKWQNYHCWACGAKGDAFTFVEKFEKVNFTEARDILARRAGIAIDEATPQDNHKSRLLDLMKWAADTYQRVLLDNSIGEGARKYLGTRSLGGGTVRQFGLGFAPLDGDWLVKQAANDGVPTELLVEVGLIAARDENRGFYDRFRDRVMFPIRDAQGRPVGFGGRILPDSPYAARGPKYYNSSDTPLFSKSDLLYGIDLARHAGSEAGSLAVVEGYTDVMMAHQSGITNVVATMGTALNARHVAQLRRYVPKVVLVFDADAGGTTGVDRALEIFVSQDVELAVATLPEGLDPADLLTRPDGADTFRGAIVSAVDALDFKLNRLMTAEPISSVDGTRRMLDAVLGIMALAPPAPSAAAQLKAELILTRLSHRLGLELRTILGRFKELQTERRRSEARSAERALPVATAKPTPKPPAGPALTLERQLVQLLLAEPALVADAVLQVPLEAITHTGLKRIMLELYALHDGGAPADLDGLRLRLLDRPDLASAAMDLQLIGRGTPDRPAYFDKVISGFARLHTDRERKSVKEQLNAVGSDDSAAIELLRRLQTSRAKG